MLRYTTGKGEDITDSFILLVSLQASSSLYEGDSNAAKAHTKGVCDLISKSFDLSTYEHWNWEHIIWNDIRVASVHLEKPLIPYRPRNMSAKLPASLTHKARQLASVTVQMISFLPRLCTISF